MWIVTKEAVVGIVRTGVMYLYALLIANFPIVNSWLTENGLSDEVQGFVSGAFVVTVGTLAYAAVRWGAEKWPNVGYLFVFNTKPSYDA